MKDRHLQYTVTFHGRVNVQGMDAVAAKAVLLDQLVTTADSLTMDGAVLDVDGLTYHCEEVKVDIREGDAE